MNLPRTATYVLKNDTLVVYVLVCCICSLVSLYLYFVSASIHHVVMRTEIEHKIGALHSELSALETDLMMVQHKVSAEIATLSGYVEPKGKVFINRGTESLVLGERQEP